MTAIAIDDEPFALEVVQKLASKVPFVDLRASFTNAFEGIDYLQKHKTDLLFLDIHMPDISGIELSKTLASPPLIVFTTAYSEHAVDGFEVDAVDYLLKPFSLTRFIKACNKAHELLTMKQPTYPPREMAIFIKDGYEQVKILLHDIKYIEAAGNYLNIFLEKNKIMTRMTIQEMIDLLPAHEFTRIHRSYIVAKQRVTKFNKQVVIIDDKELPIGGNYFFSA